MNGNRIYMDWASSTPVHPKVARAVYAAMEDYSGNPSAPHAEGVRASRAVHDARTAIARTLAVKPEELLFTGGGTEANNIAIRGVVEALHARGIAYEKMHAVTSSTEHASVLEAFGFLERLGVSVTYINPPFDGVVSADSVFDALKPETVLVSLAHVNSETGVIAPLPDIARAVIRFRERGLSPFSSAVPEFALPVLHADAAQSPMYLEAGPHALHADLVTYDAQKLRGPKGVGILYRDFSVPLSAITGGGTQERGLRPGTENVSGIIGASVAFELAHEGRAAREKRTTELRDILIREVARVLPEARLIGHPKRRIANNAFFAIPKADGDYLAVLMDKEGIAVTPRSACTGSGGGHSHVAAVLTGDTDLAKGTIRFSLGPYAEEGDIHRAVAVLKKVAGLSVRKS